MLPTAARSARGEFATVPALASIASRATYVTVAPSTQGLLDQYHDAHAYAEATRLAPGTPLLFTPGPINTPWQVRQAQMGDTGSRTLGIVFFFFFFFFFCVWSISFVSFIETFHQPIDHGVRPFDPFGSLSIDP